MPFLIISGLVIGFIALNQWHYWQLLWCSLGHHPLVKKNTWMDPEEEKEIGWRIGLDTCACRKHKHHWIIG